VRPSDPEMLVMELVAPMMLWRQLQALKPDHRFITDYRGYIKQHVAHFLRATAPDKAPKAVRKK
jgi:hypothetical protein